MEALYFFRKILRVGGKHATNVWQQLATTAKKMRAKSAVFISNKLNSAI